MLKDTIIISLVFFFLIGFLGLIHYLISDELKIETTYVFIALVPFIVMLFLSGKLAEIRGPGGLGLVLRNEAKGIASPNIDEPVVFDESQIMGKGGTNMLQRIFAENPPSTLSFQIGMQYSEPAIITYLKELRKLPRFQNILFIDQTGKFEGFILAEDFHSLVSNVNQNIVMDIMDGQILNRPEVTKSSVSKGITNQAALREMDRIGCNILAVTDNQKRFVGTISQEEIVRKILTKVLQEA